MKKQEVKQSLLEQLQKQGKYTAHNIDMVEKYMELWSLAKMLKADIAKKGLRYSTVNGNGIETEKDNMSVKNYASTITTMQNIRQKMKLDEPMPVEESDDSYL